MKKHELSRCRFSAVRRWGALLAATTALACAGPARGQVEPSEPILGGVYIDADQTVRHRQVDQSERLREMRRRMAGAARASRNPTIAYVSLPSVFREVTALRQAGQPIPEKLRYLSGITRLRYVFVYPEQGDLVISGPREPIDTTHPDRPVGTISGRPVLQLGDLLTAMSLKRGNGAFGCSIDPPRGAMEASTEVMNRYTPMRSSQRPALARDMKQAIGPQEVRLFGAPENSRMAFACVAADVKLKRHVMGIDRPPLGPAHAVETRAKAANRFWFSAAYEPLAQSPDKLSYQLRGPSLKVQASKLMFKTGGATPKAEHFAKTMSAQIETLAEAEPAYADLQNLADLALLCALIRTDGLDRKVNWDPSPLLKPDAYPMKRYPVPKHVETEVAFTAGSVAAGGVYITTADYARPESRVSDEAVAEQRLENRK